MKTLTKTILLACFIGGLGLSGLARTVLAQPQSQVTITPQQHSSTLVAQANNRDAESDGETKDDAQEQQESVRLQSLAKITPEQAKLAAEAAQGGKASNVQLENENGNLVYAVTIGQQEVKVDAGNGKVLYTENANQENEKSEASRPHSSIQVPETGYSSNEVNDPENTPVESGQ